MLVCHNMRWNPNTITFMLTIPKLVLRNKSNCIALYSTPPQRDKGRGTDRDTSRCWCGDLHSLQIRPALSLSSDRRLFGRPECSSTVSSAKIFDVMRPVED